jgi:hypothetical protein
MGIRSILAGIRGGVESVVPASAPRVRFSTTPEARDADPWEWIESLHRGLREYVVALGTHPTLADPGGACLLQAVVLVRVAYPLAELPGEEQQIILAEDAARILQAVALDPATWGGADVIWRDGSTPYAEVQESDDGRPVTVVLTIPLTVRYRE